MFTHDQDAINKLAEARLTDEQEAETVMGESWTDPSPALWLHVPHGPAHERRDEPPRLPVRLAMRQGDARPGQGISLVAGCLWHGAIRPHLQHIDDGGLRWSRRRGHGLPSVACARPVVRSRVPKRRCARRPGRRSFGCRPSIRWPVASARVAASSVCTSRTTAP